MYKSHIPSCEKLYMYKVLLQIKIRVYVSMKFNN
jgi:hypothetical protein